MLFVFALGLRATRVLFGGSMVYPVVEAESRVGFGKGFARRARAAGKIPAVAYGLKRAPEHVLLPAAQMSLIMRRANALLQLKIDARESLVLIKQVQRDRIRNIIEHLDMLFVNEDDAVTIRVPLRFVGQSYAGTVTSVENYSVAVTLQVSQIPEALVVDVSGLQAGRRIFASDIALPDGALLVSPPRLLIAKVDPVRRATQEPPPD
ncbi:50S ribosomal protein L25/general stress protein Ctc [Tropheryma whipplei]|nr:50S ribosomal protein L25/general stress protein Ctc [Tropheryma whipplei]